MVGGQGGQTGQTGDGILTACESALLLQSVLMIAAQLFLLSLLIKFRPGSFASSSHSVSSGDQPSSTAPAVSASATRDTASAFVPPTPSSNPEAPPNPWKNTTSATAKWGAGGYHALLNDMHLPPPPILGYQEGEEEEEREREGAGQGGFSRVASKVSRFFKAGFRMGDKQRLDGSSGSRPFGFWTWQTMSSYLIFLALLIAFLAVLHLLLGSLQTYIALLGYFALGLESTLPIPQAISNQRRQSLSGFRWTVLLGWLGGDLFKTVYFLLQGSPLQFTICAIFQLSVDCIIAAQMYFFRHKTAQDDEEQRLNEAEALEAGRAQGEDEEASLEAAPPGPPRDQFLATSSHFRIEADDDEDHK